MPPIHRLPEGGVPKPQAVPPSQEQSSLFPKIFRFVNFTILVNGIEEIDTDRQTIILNMALTMSWQDSRVSCPRCGDAEVTQIEKTKETASENDINQGTSNMFSLYCNMDTGPPAIQGDHDGFQRSVGKKRENDNFPPKQQHCHCFGCSHNHPQLPNELHLLPL